MARPLNPTQTAALELLQVRVLEYAEHHGVASPTVRFQPDLFDGRTWAHYQATGIPGIRPDHTLTFFNPEIAYDPSLAEEVLAHEFLHYLERITNSMTHVQIRRNRNGRPVLMGKAHGEHAPEFYRKLADLQGDMMANCPV